MQKQKLKKVYVFDVLKSEVTSFNSIADAVRTITMYDDKFDSKCATFSTCCKLNTFFNKQFLVSYIDKFKLPKRHRFIIDTKNNIIYTFDELKEKLKISLDAVKQKINNPDTQYMYLIDCARIKLRESGKLLEGQP